MEPMLGHVGEGGVTSGAMFGGNIGPFHAVRAVTVAKRREYTLLLKKWEKITSAGFARHAESQLQKAAESRAKDLTMAYKIPSTLSLFANSSTC